MSTSVHPTQSIPSLIASPRSASNRVLRGLAWKEIRQTIPLFVMLLGLELLLHLLVLASSRGSGLEMHKLFLVLIPNLFAVGYGAISVSQDKEQRTILWLNSLPIRPADILCVKLSLGLVGLLAVWLASLLMSSIFNAGVHRSDLIQFRHNTNDLIPPFLWPLNSVFLLFLGIATAWRWQSVLVALFMVVPLATLPTLFGLIETMWLDLTGHMASEIRLSGPLQLLNYLLPTMLFAWLGWRFGYAFLTASNRPHRITSAWHMFDIRESRGSSLPKSSQGLASSLVWQFAWQNRLVPLAIVSAIVLPAVLMLFFRPTENLDKHPEAVALPLVAGWLVACWLSASVFQSDGVQGRIRFLAERGIAPGTIWWTRQIVPASIIALATFVMALVIGIAQFVIRGETHGGIASTIPLIALGFPISFAIFSAGQWYGQVFRSPIASIVTVPAAMLAVVGYVAFAVYELGSPIWLVCISFGIGILATRVMMHPWMDGRTGIRYLLGHLGFFVVALVLPAIPFLTTMATYPSMPSSAYYEFQEQASRLRGGMSQPIGLVQKPRSDEINVDELMSGLQGMGKIAGGGEITDAEIDVAPVRTETYELKKLGFIEQIQSRLDAYESQLASTSDPIQFDQSVTFVAAEATLSGINLKESAGDPLVQERYRRAMSLLNQIDTRVRKSWRLVDQEGADRLECWMLEQVRDPNARDRLGPTLFASIVRSLGDREGRMQARRRAIVLSWYDGIRPTKQLTLGGLNIPNSTKLHGTMRAQLADSRQVSLISWLLMQYLNSQDQTQANQHFARMSEAWMHRTLKRTPYPGLNRYGAMVAGQGWLGEWETDAQTLAKTLD
ncbi:MAG: hypothetical protein ABL921_05000 [Pirellula sp.]